MSRIRLVSTRWEGPKVAAATLGLAVLLMAAAYAFGGMQSGVTLGGAVTAGAALIVAGSGLLYAFRLGAGGLVD